MTFEEFKAYFPKISRPDIQKQFDVLAFNLYNFLSDSEKATFVTGKIGKVIFSYASKIIDKEIALAITGSKTGSLGDFTSTLAYKDVRGKLYDFFTSNELTQDEFRRLIAFSGIKTVYRDYLEEIKDKLYQQKKDAVVEAETDRIVNLAVSFKKNSIIELIKRVINDPSADYFYRGERRLTTTETLDDLPRSRVSDRVADVCLSAEYFLKQLEMMDPEVLFKIVRKHVRGLIDEKISAQYLTADSLDHYDPRTIREIAAIVWNYDITSLVDDIYKEVVGYSHDFIDKEDERKSRISSEYKALAPGDEYIAKTTWHNLFMLLNRIEDENVKRLIKYRFITGYARMYNREGRIATEEEFVGAPDLLVMLRKLEDLGLKDTLDSSMKDLIKSSNDYMKARYGDTDTTLLMCHAFANACYEVISYQLFLSKEAGIEYSREYNKVFNNAISRVFLTLFTRDEVDQIMYDLQSLPENKRLGVYYFITFMRKYNKSITFDADRLEKLTNMINFIDSYTIDLESLTRAASAVGNFFASLSLDTLTEEEIEIISEFDPVYIYKLIIDPQEKLIFKLCYENGIKYKRGYKNYSKEMLDVVFGRQIYTYRSFVPNKSTNFLGAFNYIPIEVSKYDIPDFTSKLDIDLVNESKNRLYRNLLGIDELVNSGWDVKDPITQLFIDTVGRDNVKKLPKCFLRRFGNDPETALKIINGLTKPFEWLPYLNYEVMSVFSTVDIMQLNMICSYVEEKKLPMEVISLMQINPRTSHGLFNHKTRVEKLINIYGVKQLTSINKTLWACPLEELDWYIKLNDNYCKILIDQREEYIMYNSLNDIGELLKAIGEMELAKYGYSFKDAQIPKELLYNTRVGALRIKHLLGPYFNLSCLYLNPNFVERVVQYDLLDEFIIRFRNEFESDVNKTQKLAIMVETDFALEHDDLIGELLLDPELSYIQGPKRKKLQ